MIEIAIPMVAITDPSSVPGLVSAATCAMLAHGILMFEIFPERNAIYVPADPTTGKYEIGSTNHSTPNELAPAMNAVAKAAPFGSIPYTIASMIAGANASTTPR